jgi:GT2 family glycosyltransferase
MELSIIIVSYNTKNMTIECIQSVIQQTKGINYEIIVLDNNSDDGSAIEIENKFPKIKLIKSKENLGFAKGNNDCSKVAVGKLLLLLNPDTLVLNNAIKKLVDFSKSYPLAGIWGGRTLFADKSLNPGSCWNKMTCWSLFCIFTGLAKIFAKSPFFNSEALGGWQRDSIKKVDIVSGCFFLIKKSLWDQLEGFDSRFFMYGEEADLCLRAKKIGYAPIITDTAEIIHYGGASEKKRAGKLIRLLKAKVQLIRNHWHPLTKEFGVFLLILWPFSRYIASKLILFFKKSNTAIESFDVWEEVWLDKENWLKGYY